MEIFILIFAVLSILSAEADAKADAIRDNGSVSHLVEFLQVIVTVAAGVILGIIVSEYHDYTIKGLSTIGGLLVGAFVFIRFSLFNLSYNRFRVPCKPLSYVGSSDKASLVDKWFTIIPEKYRVIVYAVSAFIAGVLLSIVEYILLVQ